MGDSWQVQRRKVKKPGSKSNEPKTTEDLVRMYENIVRDYKTERCPQGAFSSCPDGRLCFYAHNENELRRDPLVKPGVERYSRGLCPKQPSCPKGKLCEMSHNDCESMYHPKTYKTKACKKGAACDRGDVCAFMHEGDVLVPALRQKLFLGDETFTYFKPTQSYVRGFDFQDSNRSPDQGIDPSLSWDEIQEQGRDQVRQLQDEVALEERHERERRAALATRASKEKSLALLAEEQEAVDKAREKEREEERERLVQEGLRDLELKEQQKKQKQKGPKQQLTQRQGHEGSFPPSVASSFTPPPVFPAQPPAPVPASLPFGMPLSVGEPLLDPVRARSAELVIEMLNPDLGLPTERSEALLRVLAGTDVGRLGRDNRGNSALLHAVSRGLADIVPHLACELSINAANKYGQTPLSVAIDGDAPEMVQALLSSGANPNLGEAGALHSVIAAGNIACALVLANCDRVNVAIPDAKGNSVLCAAAQRGMGPIVQVLARRPGLLNLRNLQGETALALAAKHGYANVVLDLLRDGADPNIADIQGCTPLLLALKSENGIAAAKVLVQTGGVDLSARDMDGSTALTLAAQRGDRSLVEKLREALGSAAF